jgi:sec-independent protein translocase protein TatC
MAAALASAYQLPPEEPDDSREGKMSFLGHLDELRKRIIRSCLAVGIGMVIAFVFINRIVTFVLAPMRRALPPGTTLVYTKPTEAFSLYINIALIAGALLAAPFIMFQVWRFIAPGLYGALGGAAFSHYIAFPYLIAFFGTFSSADLLFMPRMADSFDLYAKMLIGMSIVFQVPAVVFFLAKMGLVTARFLWRNIKYAVLVIFIVAAVLTPSSDPYNQMIFAAPMIGLYVISIGIAWMVGAKRERAASAITRSGAVPLIVAGAAIDRTRKIGQRSPNRLFGKR